LSVHNFGPALAPAAISLLFDPWHCKSRRGRVSVALGFGLHVSRHIVHAHGGTIEVESAHATGTRFDVFLPQAT
jgi:C4-dicarboxylate-specific signal transduction histidine kinase